MPAKRKCPTPWKIAFRDEISAQLVILKRQGTGHRREHTESRTYKCPCGRHWHLTSDKDKIK